MLILDGCASTASQKLCFSDGRCVEAVSVEQRTSILNATIVTATEDSRTKSVAVAVNQGTSVGKAMLDVGTAAVQAGGIAAAGALVSNPSANISITPH